MLGPDDTPILKLNLDSDLAIDICPGSDFGQTVPGSQHRAVGTGRRVHTWQRKACATKRSAAIRAADAAGCCRPRDCSSTSRTS